MELTFPRIIHKRGGLEKRCEDAAQWAVDQANGWVIDLREVWGLPAEDAPVAEAAPEPVVVEKKRGRPKNGVAVN